MYYYPVAEAKDFLVCLIKNLKAAKQSSVTISEYLPFPSSADSLSLHQVRTVSEAGCVTQEDREPADVQRCLYNVPGGAGDGRHNGCRSLA